jgi:hypothetical protein
MSKPDPTGESLESILASIRKSLSEQSTGVLEEDAGPPAEAAKGAISGLARRLADSDDSAPLVIGDAPPLLAEEAELEDVSLDEPLPLPGERPADGLEPLPELPSIPGDPPLIVPPPAREVVAEAPAAPPPPREEPRKDALWFLGMRGRQASAQSAPPPPAETARAPEPAPQPTPSRGGRPGVVRGPLPPFFGSSAEAQKAEVVLVQPAAPGGGVALPPAKPVSNGQAGPVMGPVMGLAAGLTGGAPAGAGSADGLRNGAASALFGPATSDAGAAPGSAGPHTHALELMVAEMLRPMLQRWLDENMPRLVAAALKDEVVRTAVRDQNKV